MSEESKDATIKKIYEHPITGYGSINDTLKQASKINPSIKVADVRDYLNKLKHRQTQFRASASALVSQRSQSHP